MSSSRQALSQPLDVLEAAGLVVAHREGGYKLHRIDTSLLRAVVDRWPIEE